MENGSGCGSDVVGDGDDIGWDRVAEIPRDYNFAADILNRNLAAGRANKPAFIDASGKLDLRPARRPRRALWRDAARARASGAKSAS